MLSEDDRNIVREYDAIVKERAKKLTQEPISFVVKSQGLYTTAGACLRTHKFGRPEWDLDIVIDYQVQMAPWLFHIIKNDRALMDKFIGHELAHIGTNGHDKEFQERAEEMGARDFSGWSSGLCISAPGGIRRLLFHALRIVPINFRFRIYTWLGAEYQVLSDRETAMRETFERMMEILARGM